MAFLSALTVSATNGVYTLPIGEGTATAALTIAGLTASGATLSLLASDDNGTSWFPVRFMGTAALAGATTLTADGIYTVATGGHTHIRLTASTAGTGSFTVASNTSTAIRALNLEGLGAGASNPIYDISQITGRVSIATPALGGDGTQKAVRVTPTGAVYIGGVNGYFTDLGSAAVAMPEDNSGNGRLLSVANYYIPGSGGANVPVAARGDTYGAYTVQAASVASTGASTYSKMATADTNAALIKSGKAKLLGLQIFNNTASTKYVRLYNKASAPAPANDAALIQRRLAVPANGVVALHISQGVDFANGLAIDATGGVADTDATALAANDLSINIDYV